MKFFVICLNRENHVVTVYRSHVESFNYNIVNPQEIFISSTLNNSESIIVAQIGKYYFGRNEILLRTRVFLFRPKFFSKIKKYTFVYHSIKL